MVKSKVGNIPVTVGNIGAKSVTFTSKNTYVKEIYEEIGQVVNSLSIDECHDFDCATFNRGRFKSVFYRAAKHYGVTIRVAIKSNSLLIKRLA